jgi:hypothetical protein
MKRTIRTLGWRFNADRMVMDYTLKCYIPAAGGTSSEVFVLTPDGETISGYYTLSAHSIMGADLPPYLANSCRVFRSGYASRPDGRRSGGARLGIGRVSPARRVESLGSRDRDRWRRGRSSSTPKQERAVSTSNTTSFRCPPILIGSSCP